MRVLWLLWMRVSGARNEDTRFLWLLSAYDFLLQNFDLFLFKSHHSFHYFLVSYHHDLTIRSNPCSCTNSAKLSFISYLLCPHPPYLSFSLSLTTYRNTSQDKGEYDSGTKHCTNTIRVQMVWLRLVIRLVLNASPLPIQTLRSPWHQVVEDLVSLLRGQLDRHLQGPVHRPLFLNQTSPQLSQTPRRNSPEGSLQRWSSHWWLAHDTTVQLQTRKVHQVHLIRTH